VRGDAAAAVSLLQRAADIADEVPDPRGAILIDLGIALREAGSLDTSEAILTGAADAARTSGDLGIEAQARIEWGFTRLLRWEGVEELRGVADETLPVLEELGADAGIARALSLAGQIEYFRCQVSAAEDLLDRALEHAQRAGDRQQARSIVSYLAATNLDGPRHAEAAIARLDDLSHQLQGDLTLAGFIATSRAPLEAMLGHFEQARELALRGRAEHDELGRRLAATFAQIQSGTVELLAGNPEAAERELRGVFDVLEDMGGTSVLAWVTALLGQSVLAQGKLAEAERHAAAAQEMTAEGDIFSQVEWRILQASLLARAGRAMEAEALAGEAVRIAEATDALNLRADAFAVLGASLDASGRPEEARATRAEAERLWERKGNRAAILRHRAAPAFQA
jgi:tetratricopeptide (TPR) repeat protein